MRQIRLHEPGSFNRLMLALIYSDARFTLQGVSAVICISHYPNPGSFYKRSASLEVYNNDPDWLSPQDLPSDWPFEVRSKVYRKPFSSRTLN